jgi:2-polyprenyl-3-methyl-5-hydroxy-6-metoxy-1,4-benzoquinol methylase
MPAFEMLCLCGERLTPLIQHGAIVPAVTLGARPGVLFTCPGCGHICAVPLPVGGERERLNDILYNPEAGDTSNYDLAAAKRDYDVAPRRHVIDLILDVLSKHFATPTGVRLHDVGAGIGDLVHHLRRAGVDANGSDPSADAVRLAHEMRNPHIVLASDMLTSDATYQVILMHHVLEHVPQPVDALSRCRGMLEAGGLILILVPNGEFLPARKFDFGRWAWSSVPGHLHFFSRRSLMVALTAAGFDAVEVSATECALSLYRAKDPAELAEEDTLQTTWLMQAADIGHAVTNGEICRHLPLLARQGVTIELLGTGVTSSGNRRPN